MTRAPALAGPVDEASAGAAEGPLALHLGEAEFTALHGRVAPRLRGFLRAQTGDAATADDLLQEAFTRVLASRFRPESEEHFVRYLFKTAVHLLADRARRSGRRPLPLAAAAEPTVEPPPPGLGADLSRALAGLKPRERQVLWLAHVEDLDHAAIGHALGVAGASVRVLLFRARRRLAALLDRDPTPRRRP